jgi:lactoylglutathione lyase
VGTVREEIERTFEADTLHKRRQRLSHQAAKDPVEVVGREARGSRHILEPQRFGEVPDNVVDGPVDADDVIDIRTIWQVAHGAAIVASEAMTAQPTTLGAFSVSLAVKDLHASRTFYEKLDFHVVGGDATQNWLILRNGVVTIGLFQGMFDRNILTFNPGWDEKAQAVASFTDVREHQRRFKANGLELTNPADESSTGPASFLVLDPDGNPILVDQHV